MHAEFRGVGGRTPGSPPGGQHFAESFIPAYVKARLLAQS